MRLLNTSTLAFQEFYEDEFPAYAILSHRWRGEDEVSYSDYCLCLDQHRYGQRLPVYMSEKADEIRSRGGYDKIQNLCAMAKKAGLDWAWIDTCCIDKSSSAELSEAINSMWNWYDDAVLCIVYLWDSYKDDPDRDFGHSDWFTRSWTLQELLAPSWVRFVDADWNPVFNLDKLLFASRSRSDSSYAIEKDPDWGHLGHKLAESAHVPAPYVAGCKSLASASVAMKLSWASYGTASRMEDRAYSLLGLLDINMPLLYGERDKAFMRLQRQFIGTHNEESLLAWFAPCISPASAVHSHGVLASKIEHFRNSGEVVSTEEVGEGTWQIIKNLMQVEVFVSSDEDWATRTSMYLPLACRYSDQAERIYLDLVADYPGGEYTAGGEGSAHFYRKAACRLDSGAPLHVAPTIRRVLLKLVHK